MKKEIIIKDEKINSQTNSKNVLLTTCINAYETHLYKIITVT